MAALGVIRTAPWVDVEKFEREALTLETVKLAVELAGQGGLDLNVANTDGRTALDAAKGLKYDSVINFLTEKGAKAGAGAAPGRGGRGGAAK